MEKEKEVNNRDPKLITAYPTKNLFISMLIRDLTLRDAIGDLVDNSVDGAQSFSKDSFQGLRIDITLNPDNFIISDNCGGFSVDNARNYAFCFGKPEGYPKTPGSIGRFGIGMKRALFKLGYFFNIQSTHESSKFEMEVNVNDWRSVDDWDFEFKSHHENEESFPKEDRGTIIKVTQLRPDVKAQFIDKNFIKKLRNEIELEHLYAIFKGLTIFINGHLLNQRNLDFAISKSIKPGYWRQQFNNGLDVDVYAGIASDEGTEGGWYIFCNERLIVGPETTPVTGWTGRKGDGVAEYHDQFHRFRGYVFFRADDAENLPWNTTKTGMDLDSPEYKAVRQKMIEMMKPVMTLMNTLKKEREADTPEEERILNKKVNEAEITNLSEVIKMKKNLPLKFTFPTLTLHPIKVKTSKGTRILYYKPKEKIEKVKESLGINTNQEVGERTFDYFLDMEIE